MSNTPTAMGGLTPIETQYNGYAFRSRLEARWAYYFDLCKIRWQYEPEGFKLSDGQWYLPDFWLPDFNQYVEVKPDDGAAYISDRPRVYLAGKMGEPKDNKIPGKCWRPLDANMDNHDFRYAQGYHDNFDFSPTVPMTLNGTRICYTGPWKGNGGNHGWQHGVTTCGEVTGEEIYIRNMTSIDNCTEFFALLTDPTAYGTLFETGIAAAKRKSVVVGVLTNESEWYADHNWFASMSANLIIKGRDDAEIVAKYATYLLAKYPHTKYDTMAIDSAKNNIGFRVVQGDPRAMKGQKNTTCRSLPHNQLAADAARMHKFGR